MRGRAPLCGATRSFAHNARPPPHSGDSSPQTRIAPNLLLRALHAPATPGASTFGIVVLLIGMLVGLLRTLRVHVFEESMFVGLVVLVHQHLIRAREHFAQGLLRGEKMIVHGMPRMQRGLDKCLGGLHHLLAGTIRRTGDSTPNQTRHRMQKES